MPNFQKFVANSIDRFGLYVKDPLPIPDKFDVNVDDKTTAVPFQITGQIFDIRFSGLSLLNTRSQVEANIANKTISINTIIPTARIYGQYKFAAEIGSDLSLTKSGSWYITGKTFAHACLNVNEWQFDVIKDNVSMKDDASHDFNLFHEQGYTGYEDFFSSFRELLSSQEAHAIDEATKAAIYLGLCKNIYAQLKPVLGTRILAELRSHLQEDFDKVGFEEIIDGCIGIVLPRVVRNLGPFNLPQPPNEKMIGSFEKIGLGDGQDSDTNNLKDLAAAGHASPRSSKKKQNERRLETSPEDIAEVVLSTNTKHSNNGMVVEIVSKKIISFKYE